MGRPKEYKRDTLLIKTIQLFWKKGLADTSLADLEKETGVNKSGLYSEFKDKNDLFSASLNHYIANTGALELLAQKPLGKKNIYNFLTLGKTCVGQRGCFAVNSLRESAILPAKARELLTEHLERVHNGLVLNLKETRYQGNLNIGADMILTFNAGVCLEQNIPHAPNPTEKIDEFFQFLKL